MKSSTLIDNIELPIIINGLAKFDGRKKQYIPYPDIIEKSGEARRREIVLLAALQGMWEKLRQAYPDKINKLKLTEKYYCKACAFKNPFLPVIVDHHAIIIDERWLRWDKALQQFEQDLHQHIQPLNSQGFGEFKTYAHDTIAQTCQTQKRIKQGYRAINRFIDYQNKHFMLTEHYYPNIIISLPTKFNPLIIDTNWVTRGKQVNKLVRAVHDHWQQTIDYSLDEMLGWLLFSGIIYGGINNKLMLDSWFRALLNKEYQPFINQRILVAPCFEQKRYGNERDAESSKLYNTQQIIVDLVSQCWLIRHHQKNSNKNSQERCLKQPQKSAEEYLMSALAMVAKPLDLPILTFTQLLAYASYHWEMLEGADIDQASVAVLCDKQNTTGLTKNSFAQFLNPVYKSTVTTYYDLDEILRLSINASKKPQTVIVTQSKHGKKVRRSDLITAITKDFKRVESLKKKRLNYTPSTLVERLKKRYQQYTAVSEQVFLDWILMLLKGESSKVPNNSSILQYVKSIGYEWLYFTMGQSINSWDEEDFEMLYEDILEYKSIARGNTDITYSAKLLQRLHNFAHKNYDFPVVVISYEKTGRRVRAELISPPIYDAIITQILNSIDILEREMFALMFILVYRTGMRKKELLGLRYIDIEGLNVFAPSVVVRNNSYRSLKTASSNRRIPIFALLKPNELAFFIRYVQSNIGLNTNKFIFTLSSAQSPIDDHVPLQLLRRILQDISGDDYTMSYTFHAFRHTAVSNLSLVLNGDSDLVEALTDYDAQDIYRIKSGLLGEHINAQDRWYALSGMMGHLSPQRSFEYYNHFATLMATYALSNADIKLPSRVINNIPGFDNKRLKQNHAVIENGDASLSSIRALLFRSIFQNKRTSPQFFVDDTSPLIEPSGLSDSLFMRYGINHVWALLQQIDEDITPKQAAMTVKMDWYDAQILIERANKVAAIVSTRGKPRFVKTTGISPLSIQYQSDFRLLSSLQNSIQQLRRTSMDDWQWFMAICQQRLSSSRAFVPFLEKEQQVLQRFIAIIKQLLPAKNWLIVTHTSYQPNADLIDIQDMRRISKAHVNTINLGIATADDRKSARHKTNWKFSPLLRFFVHMMLITDDGLSIVNTQIEHTSQND